MKTMQLARAGGAAAGAAVVSFAVYSALAWARFGHAHPERHSADPSMDRFLPGPDVDEYHQRTIGARRRSRSRWQRQQTSRPRR